MDLTKAQKIHELMIELYEIERFLSALNRGDVEPEVWLRRKDGSVAGVASENTGEYRLSGLKEMLINYFDLRKGAINDEIAGM